jgi:2-polyprenyl-6-methoxyphenol hydroxylase-like FAD-dependent oxidoreductase
VRADYEVAIVGYGPVGQTAAILLGRMGHKVAVFERWPALYPLPRAVHYDDEIARVFQHMGLAERLEPITEPATTYEWKNARGETLLLLDRSGPGVCGWPAANMFTQPELEQLLDETARSVPSVEVYQGWEVNDVEDDGASVRLSVRSGEVDSRGEFVASGEQRVVSARYAIGCDGANSLVRERMGTPVVDLGFAFDWLIADTVPHDPKLLEGVNLQHCDPARPTTLVSGGPGRRRWEWMLLPGETREQVEAPEFVWGLLAKSGVRREDVTLERHCVYTFRARWAERWRLGRMLLAGDAAHLMPPFAGQGMCSGIRDAFTLSWELDLVLKGAAADSLLDAYSSERCGHLQHAISLSVELGKVICISDHAQAAARDEVLLAAAADQEAPPIQPPAPLLGPGIREEPPAEGVGSLFPQAPVRFDGRERLLEDEIGRGFHLYALDAEPAGLLDDEALAFANELGVALISVDEQFETGSTYRDWFRAHGCVAAVVRPDFYVFGTAATYEDLPVLMRRLQAALPLTSNKQERATA